MLEGKWLSDLEFRIEWFGVRGLAGSGVWA